MHEVWIPVSCNFPLRDGPNWKNPTVGWFLGDLWTPGKDELRTAFPGFWLSMLFGGSILLMFFEPLQKEGLLEHVFRVESLILSGRSPGFYLDFKSIFLHFWLLQSNNNFFSRSCFFFCAVVFIMWTTREGICFGWAKIEDINQKCEARISHWYPIFYPGPLPRCSMHGIILSYHLP